MGGRWTENRFAGRWGDWRLPLISARSGGVAPPTWSQLRDNGSGSVGVFGWHFGSSGVGHLHTDDEQDHDFLEGSDMDIHLHWRPKTAAVGSVVLGVEFVVVNAFDVMPLTTIYEEAFTTPGEALKGQVSVLGTVDGSALKISHLVSARVYRDGPSGSYGDDIVVHTLGLHYQRDYAGSRQVYSK